MEAFVLFAAGWLLFVRARLYCLENNLRWHRDDRKRPKRRGPRKPKTATAADDHVPAYAVGGGWRNR